jgi:hypothetical protein
MVTKPEGLSRLHDLSSGLPSVGDRPQTVQRVENASFGSTRALPALALVGRRQPVGVRQCRLPQSAGGSAVRRRRDLALGRSLALAPT